jgi:TetR/AcrR family transcriptional regulator, cholesterol catabolism regulator
VRGGSEVCADVGKMARADVTRPTETTKAQRKRESQLLEKAVELFSNGGYRETSLQDVADKLGITRPLFYYYFETKEDLLWRIIGHLGDHLLESALPIGTSDDTPTSRLRRLLETHVQVLLSNLDAFRIYFAERHLLKGVRDRRLKRGEGAYESLISEVISDGQRLGQFRGGDPAILTRLLTGMANSVTRWYVPTGSLSVDELSRMVADCAIASVAESG